MSIDEWARKQAEKIIAAQVAAIQQSQQIYLDELNRQAQERVKQGQALAAWLQGQNFPGRIQSLYGTAAGDIAGYAQGFSGSMRNIANADAAQAANMLSGTGQEGAVRNEGEGMGNVMYGAFGYNPAHSMSESGAAYAADAAMQPAFATQMAAHEAAQMQQEGLGALKDFAMQIAEVRGGKPELVMEYAQMRREAAQQAAEDEFKKYMALASLELRRGNAKRADQYVQMAYMAKQGLDPNGNPLPGYYRDKNGYILPKGYRYNNKGELVSIKKPNEKDKTKGIDWGKLQEEIADNIPSLTKKVPDPSDYHRPPREIEVPMSYKEAFDILMSRFSGQVKNKARLRAMIRRLLIANGIKPQSETQQDRHDREG